jgi:excisionase family DNA binding protein
MKMTVQDLRAKPPALLSPKETAIVAGVSPSTVQRALKRGELQASRVGGRVIITRQSLFAWLGATVEPLAGILPLENWLKTPAAIERGVVRAMVGILRGEVAQ